MVPSPDSWFYKLHLDYSNLGPLGGNFTGLIQQVFTVVHYSILAQILQTTQDK